MYTHTYIYIYIQMVNPCENQIESIYKHSEVCYRLEKKIHLLINQYHLLSRVEKKV